MQFVNIFVSINFELKLNISTVFLVACLQGTANPCVADTLLHTLTLWTSEPQLNSNFELADKSFGFTCFIFIDYHVLFLS